MQLLSDYLERQYLLARPVGAGAAYQLRHTIRLFGLSLGRPAKIRDLNDETASLFIRWLEERYARRTTYGHRGSLLGVWRDAFESGATNVAPRRVRSVKKPKPNPSAWTLADVARLVKACQDLEGVLKNGVRRSLYFQALFLAAYETGLRRSDLWRLRRIDISQNGTVVVEQRKTETPHVCGMSQLTTALVLSIELERPLAWPHSRRHFYDHAHALCRSAGIPRGALQMTRRTAATGVYEASGNPAVVQQFLGHLSPDMWRHYVARQAVQQVVRPPRLPDGPLPAA